MKTLAHMQNPYSEDMLVGVVKETLAGVLGCDIEELDADAAIGDDLGAESLDFVEMRYDLERRLGISLPQRSVVDQLAFQAPGQPAVQNGRLTEFGAQALQDSLFGYSPSLAREGARLHEIMQGATIRNWARLCGGILDGLPERCGDCGHGKAVVGRSGKPACGGCGAVLKPANGDEALAAATAAWLSSEPALIAA